MLIVFGGLPGTGKTTISRALAGRRTALYLRIDTIEQATRDAGVLAGDVGAAGYTVAGRVAEDNLMLGRTVVIDCVNPVVQTRAAWRALALRAACRLVELEITCSDQIEHRRRVESRTADIPGLICPTWADVLAREYEVWAEPHLTIDTACLNSDEAVSVIDEYAAARIDLRSI